MTAVLVGETEAELRVRTQQRGEKEGTDGDALLSEPPHGWIVGTVERAAEQLIALREAGVSRVMCQHLVHDDLDMVALIGERLAPLVA
jgi:alkanesulfonate monooxygenase SsuD/methylene tetrahydromethanopterin reductase-like flavin-dependent oxidoreductase (luciferase family)